LKLLHNTNKQFDLSISAFFKNVGDGNWRQVEAWIWLLAWAAQEAPRRFIQRLWVYHSTFTLRGRHFTTELSPLSLR